MKFESNKSGLIIYYHRAYVMFLVKHSILLMEILDVLSDKLSTIKG